MVGPRLLAEAISRGAAWSKLLRHQGWSVQTCQRAGYATAPDVATTSEALSVQDFLKSLGGGVESHADKIAQELQQLPDLLFVRSGRLKELGVPCQQRKLILRYTEQYRQGFWRPKRVGPPPPSKER